ncbi:hypothetical protein [Catelliglobosispora koreensis]|uniref:hypothetical protein n=1 Tax=Catelliglobosispora koreensis TaxID=129052 RepID=UPI00036A4889|nr:hypothetical protein [Catelliglobosispora koreensis]
MTSPISQPRVSGKTADILSSVFYGGVALTALAGQISAADKLGISSAIAVPGIALLELGGVALAARADFRRRLGENAYAARILSGAVAVFAVVFNWYGHADNLYAAGVFSFMSALGYLVWLINSGDRRRDQLRAEGKLTATPPVYGIAQWAKHPFLTRRARALASADPSLGVHGSLEAAADADRLERRQTAIAKALKDSLAKSVDPATAAIAVATFDLDQIAARLAAEADYDGLTALIGAKMTPVLLTASADAAAVKTEARKRAARPDGDATGKTAVSSRKTGSTGELVAKVLSRKPDATPVDVAKAIGKSERTVQRYWPKPETVSPELIPATA